MMQPQLVADHVEIARESSRPAFDRRTTLGLFLAALSMPEVAWAAPRTANMLISAARRQVGVTLFYDPGLHALVLSEWRCASAERGLHGCPGPRLSRRIRCRFAVAGERRHASVFRCLPKKLGAEASGPKHRSSTRSKSPHLFQSQESGTSIAKVSRWLETGGHLY